MPAPAPTPAPGGEPEQISDREDRVSGLRAGRGSLRAVEFHGDTAGIAALKALYAKDKGYLKFLLGEARSNTDFIARFTDDEVRQVARHLRK